MNFHVFFGARGISGFLGAVLLAASVAVRGETPEDWITPTERALFETVGNDARVRGHSIGVDPDYRRLPKLAVDARQPLRGRIEAVFAAFERGRTTPEEKAMRDADRRNLIAAIERIATKGSTAGAPAPDADAKEALVESARAAVERKLGAMTEAYRVTDEVADDLEKRLGRSRPETDLELEVVLSGGGLELVGNVGKSPMTLPLLRVVLHRRADDARPLAIFGITGKFTRTADGGMVDEHGRKLDAKLVTVADRMVKLPVHYFVPMPYLLPGDQFRLELNIDQTDAAGVDHVEASLLSGEGVWKTAKASGLEVAQEKAARLEEESSRKMRTLIDNIHDFQRAKAAREASGSAAGTGQPAVRRAARPAAGSRQEAQSLATAKYWQEQADAGEVYG